MADETSAATTPPTSSAPAAADAAPVTLAAGTPTAEVTPAPTAIPAAIDPAASPADWRTGIDAELLPKIEKFKEPAGLAKSYVEAEARMGQLQEQMKQMVLLPGDNSNPEEVALFRKRLGIPDTPGGYDVEIPEDDAGKERMTNALAALHDAGASNSVVQAALKVYNGMVAGQQQAATGTAEEHRAKHEETLRDEWGDKFDAKIALVSRAFANLYPREQGLEVANSLMADGSRLGDNPAFVRLLAAHGATMGEASGSLLVSSDQGQAGTPHPTEAVWNERVKDPRYRSGPQFDKAFREETHRMAQMLFGKPNSRVLGA